MVSLLRKPVGFALIFFLVSSLLGMLLRHLALPLGTLGLIIPTASLVLFTIIYILVVRAHLSHRFIWHAGLYCVLFSFLFMIIANLIMDFGALVPVLTHYRVWLAALSALLSSYFAIFLGNWLARYMFKTKGHI